MECCRINLFTKSLDLYGSEYCLGPLCLGDFDLHKRASGTEHVIPWFGSLLQLNFSNLFDIYNFFLGLLWKLHFRGFHCAFCALLDWELPAGQQVSASTFNAHSFPSSYIVLAMLLLSPGCSVSTVVDLKVLKVAQKRLMGKWVEPENPARHCFSKWLSCYLVLLLVIG